MKSQSFTSMDAPRTKPLTKLDIQLADSDYLRSCLEQEDIDTRTEELMQEELTRRKTRRPITPIYPEPEGEPSF